jgi:hypothetical protein
MTITQILDELPGFTFEERQLLIRRAIELDDPPLSEADEGFVEARLAAHHADPGSSLSLEEIKERLRRA